MLQEREQRLQQREAKLLDEEERLMRLAQLDVKLQFDEFKRKYITELAVIQSEFKEKLKENKRLHEAFRTLKQSNEALKERVKYSRLHVFYACIACIHCLYYQDED